jgi:Skp family chaperone for outer membrane proteins
LAGISAGVVTFGLLAYLGNSLWVHAQPGASGGTRVATVNMYVVMKNYKKVEVYKNEITKLAEPFETKMKELQKNYDQWVTYSKTPNLSEADKNKATQALTTLKRQMEDHRTEAQKVLMKRGQEQIVQVYREIEDAVQKYAASNGIHLVLHYLEPVGSEVYTATNVDRKMNGPGNVGACSPIFIAPSGVDISNEVVHVLNSSVK